MPTSTIVKSVDGTSVVGADKVKGKEVVSLLRGIYRRDSVVYCGNVVYDRGEVRLLNDEGYVTFTDGKPVRHYFLRDHLGSVRVVMNDDGSTVEQVNHYYAFGGVMAGSTGAGIQPLKYNGKELERANGLNLSDYGARWYDAAAPSWLTPDPLAEKDPGISPYVYCRDNPVRYVDPDGNFPHLWQAQISRWFHNLFHKIKAGPIQTNDAVKDSRFRYTYDTYSSTSNGEFVITANYKFDTTLAQNVQDVGDGIALAGYAATLTGAGAEVGVPAAAVGNGISSFGTGCEIVLDFLNGEFGDSFKGFMYYALEKTIDTGIDKIMPGNIGPSKKEISEYIIDGLRGRGKGKQILYQEFNLGKSFLSQGASLKMKIAEHTVDTIIERKKQDSQEEQTK